MTRKSGIKPPPIPPGEDPMVTIGTQEKQIDMLLKRIETLTEQCDTYAKDCREAEMKLDEVCARVKILESKVTDMRAAAVRMLGWQDAARELFKNLLGN